MASFPNPLNDLYMGTTRFPTTKAATQQHLAPCILSKVGGCRFCHELSSNCPHHDLGLDYQVDPDCQLCKELGPNCPYHGLQPPWQVHHADMFQKQTSYTLSDTDLQLSFQNTMADLFIITVLRVLLLTIVTQIPAFKLSTRRHLGGAASNMTQQYLIDMLAPHQTRTIEEWCCCHYLVVKSGDHMVCPLCGHICSDACESHLLSTDSIATNDVAYQPLVEGSNPYLGNGSTGKMVGASLQLALDDGSLFLTPEPCMKGVTDWSCHSCSNSNKDSLWKRYASANQCYYIYSPRCMAININSLDNLVGSKLFKTRSPLLKADKAYQVLFKAMKTKILNHEISQTSGRFIYSNLMWQCHSCRRINSLRYDECDFCCPGRCEYCYQFEGKLSIFSSNETTTCTSSPFFETATLSTSRVSELDTAQENASDKHNEPFGPTTPSARWTCWKCLFTDSSRHLRVKCGHQRCQRCRLGTGWDILSHDELHSMSRSVLNPKSPAAAFHWESCLLSSKQQHRSIEVRLSNAQQTAPLTFKPVDVFEDALNMNADDGSIIKLAPDVVWKCCKCKRKNWNDGTCYWCDHQICMVCHNVTWATDAVGLTQDDLSIVGPLRVPRDTMFSFQDLAVQKNFRTKGVFQQGTSQTSFTIARAAVVALSIHAPFDNSLPSSNDPSPSSQPKFSWCCCNCGTNQRNRGLCEDCGHEACNWCQIWDSSKGSLLVSNHLSPLIRVGSPCEECGSDSLKWHDCACGDYQRSQGFRVVGRHRACRDCQIGHISIKLLLGSIYPFVPGLERPQYREHSQRRFSWCCCKCRIGQRNRGLCECCGHQACSACEFWSVESVLGGDDTSPPSLEEHRAAEPKQ